MKVWGPGKTLRNGAWGFHTTIIQRKVRTQSILKNCLGNLNETFFTFWEYVQDGIVVVRGTAVSDISAFRISPNYVGIHLKANDIRFSHTYLDMPSVKLACKMFRSNCFSSGWEVMVAVSLQGAASKIIPRECLKSSQDRKGCRKLMFMSHKSPPRIAK